MQWKCEQNEIIRLLKQENNPVLIILSLLLFTSCRKNSMPRLWYCIILYLHEFSSSMGRGFPKILQSWLRILMHEGRLYFKHKILCLKYSCDNFVREVHLSAWKWCLLRVKVDTCDPWCVNKTFHMPRYLFLLTCHKNVGIYYW